MWKRHRHLRVLLSGTLVLLLAGCGGTGPDRSPDHSALLRAELTAAGIGPDVVDCVLGLAGTELERGSLAPAALDEARLHCRTARLADAGTEHQAVPDTELALTDVPWDRGDDPGLDDLWARCEQGEGAACDQLFERSAVGSIYEEFGVSCGGRPDVMDCRELDLPDETTGP